jgi:hypothetical protein
VGHLVRGAVQLRLQSNGGKGGEVDRRRGSIAIIDVIRIGEADARPAIVDAHQIVRVVQRRRPQESGADGQAQSAVQARAERDRQNDARCMARLAGHDSHAKAKILQK